MYKLLFTSSKGTILFEAETSVSINSKPEPDGIGKLPVIPTTGNELPEGVNPKNAKYKSSVLKLFEYKLTANSFMASETKSFDIPKSNLLSASNLFVISLA